MELSLICAVIRKTYRSLDVAPNFNS